MVVDGVRGLEGCSVIIYLNEWTPLIIHEKMAGNRDAQTHAQIKMITNKTPPGLLLVGGTHCFGQAMDCCLLVVGSINFTILFGNRL